MDIHLPGESGIACTAKLKARLPEIQVIILTVYKDTELIFSVLKAGASGYLLKRADERNFKCDYRCPVGWHPHDQGNRPSPGISPKSVRSHLGHIYEKLYVQGQTKAVSKYLKTAKHNLSLQFTQPHFSTVCKTMFFCPQHGYFTP